MSAAHTVTPKLNGMPLKIFMCYIFGQHKMVLKLIFKKQKRVLIIEVGRWTFSFNYLACFIRKIVKIGWVLSKILSKSRHFYHTKEMIAPNDNFHSDFNPFQCKAEHFVNYFLKKEKMTLNHFKNLKSVQWILYLIPN